MRLEKYQSKANKTQTVFYFTSEGPNGRILKKVRYSKIKYKGIKNLYSLGFGDINNETGDFDDSVITDNQDREKVLATVAQTVILFTQRYPKAYIFFEGSSDSRNRLYQMAINKYFDELSETFDIQGSFNKKWFSFEKNVKYDGFLIRLKKD